MKHRAVLVSIVVASASFAGSAAPAPPPSTAPARKPASAQLADGNRPERLEWFRDLGFGLFVHWGLDSQLGSVISHSLVGADEGYRQRFFQRLPHTFDPWRYRPRDWAVLAKLAGMKYVVFTTKHHSGFCMFDTKTTPFNVMETPYGKDVTAQLVTAFREQGIAVGFYFSPDDFWYLHQNGKVIDRDPRPGVTPQEDPRFLEYDRAQIRELMTGYGPIDVVFIDGPAEGLRELVWEIQPHTVVTRGAIVTPEQRIPGVPLDQAWESCVTMGTQWQYKPSHETYKSGTQLIEMLIETRAKGGNLLLNVGPKPDGELPIEQEERLREIALWNFAFGESIEGVRPWVVTNEGNVWFTRRKGEDTVYAFVTKVGNWALGERRTFDLRSLKVGANARVSILGQTGEVLEYRPDVDPRPKWHQDENGLHITATMSQRLYNDRRWPNPVVLKITDARPALTPPLVETTRAVRHTGEATLFGALKSLGDARSLEVGFQYRRQKRSEELYEKEEAWLDLSVMTLSEPGEFSAVARGLSSGVAYEYRAIAKHPLLPFYGEEKAVAAGAE